MMIATRIRPALPDDSEGIARLSGQLGYSSTPEEIHARLADIEQKPGHVVFVAERDGEVVGWVHLLADLHLESGVFTEIAGLVVDERYRGGGIGRALVEAAGEWSRAKGCTSLRVRMNVLRKETRKFYERMGFEMVKEQVVFKRKV